MSIRIKSKSLAMAISSVLAFGSSTMFATNGYYTLGYSAKDKGSAGTGVARGSDALSMATNPASMLNVGERSDFGLNLFSPIREYSVSGSPAIPGGFTPVIGNIPSCSMPGMAPC